MKGSTQCAASVKKANSMLGLIKKGMENQTANMKMPLYKTLVGPHLEYSVQFWLLHFKKDIVELEKVQKRATKMRTEQGHLPDEERRQRLGLLSPEKRGRLRGDMTETYKIMQGVDDSLFALSCNPRTGGGGIHSN